MHINFSDGVARVFTADTDRLASQMEISVSDLYIDPQCIDVSVVRINVESFPVASE